MKKINVLALLLITLFSFIAIGCSKKTEAKPLENGILKISLNKAGYGAKWVQDAIPGFEEEYKIKVVVTEVPNLTTRLADQLDIKGSIDDLYFVSLQPSDWMKWTEYGKCVLEPLEDIECISRLNSSIKEWGSRTVRGEKHLYALHPNIALETFVYNQDYLNKIESNGEYTKGEWPTTWQGLLDLSEQLVVNMNGKIEGKKVYPYAIYLKDDFEPQKLYETLFAQGNGGKDYYNYWNFDIKHKESTEEDKSVFVNDSFVDAMWALDEFLNVESSDYFKDYGGDLEAIKGFLKGESLFCWHGSFFETEAKDIIESSTLNKIGDNYRIGVVPAISGDETDRTINLNWPHENIVVPNFAENKENAKLFINYIYSDSNIINIVKAMNAIPGFEHTFTEEEKSSLPRWTKEVVETYEKFSNTEVYENGISFRNSTSRVYRGATLNSLNFNSVGEPVFFGYQHCTNPTYQKNSKDEYRQLFSDYYDSGIANKKWAEWTNSKSGLYPVK